MRENYCYLNFFPLKGIYYLIERVSVWWKLIEIYNEVNWLFCPMCPELQLENSDIFRWKRPWKNGGRLRFMSREWNNSASHSTPLFTLITDRGSRFALSLQNYFHNSLSRPSRQYSHLGAPACWPRSRQLPVKLALETDDELIEDLEKIHYHIEQQVDHMTMSDIIDSFQVVVNCAPLGIIRKWVWVYRFIY